jgi:hypothetical protein
VESSASTVLAQYRACCGSLGQHGSGAALHMLWKNLLNTMWGREVIGQ